MKKASYITLAGRNPSLGFRVHGPHWIALSCLALATMSAAEADPKSPPPTNAVETAPEAAFAAAEIEFFEKSVRPLIAKNCLECHSGVNAPSGLQLNHRAGWLRGSDYRAVIDLDSPSDSILIQAVTHQGGGDVPKMPKDGDPLAPEAVEALIAWIEMGLPWPEEKDHSAIDPLQHWSFQPVSPPELPADAGHPVDYFLGEAQRDAGVVPAPLADRATLYRRAHLTLLGLPPKYEQQQVFVDDPRPDEEAWPALIDHLMGSQHYGERWARLWMDLARYADTRGYEGAGVERRFIYSYTYRDWLIRAFNEDLPYDQFLLYQLAGEQLVDWEGPDKHHLAALGFLSLSKNGNQELILDDRVDTTFRGLMALTVSCARCHDHKSDPVSTQEYYGLYGVFLNSMVGAQPVIGEEGSGPEYDAYREELAKMEAEIDEYLEPLLKAVAEKHPEHAENRDQLIRHLERPDSRELRNRRGKVDKFVADSQMGPARALVLGDRESRINQHIFIRGEPSRRGDVAPPRFLSFGGEERPVYEKGSGRLEMARDIVSPGNPLTARNLVNRVWMWHFGEGIVRSVDDFGIEGDRPDHPELLDWLAHWFTENGSSIKSLNRLLMSSEAWRRQSHHPDAAETAVNRLADAENRLLWQFPRRRLELEQMRDAMLDVVGNLDNTLYGHPVAILEPPYSNRRSVYAFIDRQNLNPVFRTFDFSSPQESTGQRPKTTVPMQALFTLNSDFVQNQAAILAERTAGEEDRLAAMHRAVFAREPSEHDRLLAESFLASFEPEIAEYAKRQTDHEWSYGWGAYDAEADRIDFKPFTHWDGAMWRHGSAAEVEGTPFRYLQVRGASMHPGNTADHCLVLRWEAPDAMRVSLQSRLVRKAVGEGNGVLARVVSDRRGQLLERRLDPTKEAARLDLPEIEVARGEILHFLVDPYENNASHDSVEWDPKLRRLDGDPTEWLLSESFSGPLVPATAWGAYAHALLNTNRFLFIE